MCRLNEKTTAIIVKGHSFLVLPKCAVFYFLMVKPKIIW